MLQGSSQISIGHTEFLVLTDNIVQVNATDHVYSINDIKTIHKTINEISTNKKVLLLLISSDFTSIDSDARGFLSSQEPSQYSIAIAYVIKSLAQRLLINFLIKVQGRPVPTKIFTKKESAIDWLKKFNPTCS